MNLTKEIVLRILELGFEFNTASVGRFWDDWNPTDPIIIEYKEHIDSEGYSNELYDDYISKYVLGHFNDKQ